MKNSYPPILLNKITDDVVIAILNALIPTLQELHISYFIVGAFARDVELLAKGHTEPPARMTTDLDLAVMVANEAEFEQLKNKLTTIDGFEIHNTEPIKLIYDNRYEVDLLPFGEIENEKGLVELKAKSIFVLDMPGFSEVFKTVDIVPTDQNFNLNVSSLPGVFLLKLLAWDDRKERTKDIVDIEYIIRNLYLLMVDEIVLTDEDLLIDIKHDRLYSEMVAARYLGRCIGRMLQHSTALKSRIRRILTDNNQFSNHSFMGQLMSFETLEDSILIIDQLNQGVSEMV